MPANHWIGPRITPQVYLESNAGLYVLDEGGVLVTLYRDRPGQAGPRREYNPAFIANFALSGCRTFVEKGDEQALASARKQLDWLLAHGAKLRWQGIEARMYPYTFEWVKFKLRAPWVSAFAQSLVGAALACGADATGSREYLAGARLAYNGLRIPVAAGGVTLFGSDSAWFEEAAKAGVPPIRILNGHMTAAEGLRNFITWRPDAVYQRLWDQHVNAVEENLRLFDAGYLSYYAQYPVGHREEWEPSGRVGYNAVHVIQLANLYELTRRPMFLDFALRFAQYETPDLGIATKGSAAPQSNGPDRLNMVMGNDYWSHGEFPTWVRVDMGDAFTVKGLHIVAHTARAAPRKFFVEASTNDRKYQRVAEVTDNRSERILVSWAPVRARYLRVVIQADNGNENTAIKGVYPVRLEPYGAVVADPASMSTNNMPALALGPQGWRAGPSGWIVFRRDSLPSGVKFIDFGSATAVEAFVAGAADAAGLDKAAEKRIACSAAPCSFPLDDVSPETGTFVRVRWRIIGATGPVNLRLRCSTSWWARMFAGTCAG